MSHSPYRFAIVGLGPRGHFALECLLKSLHEVGVSDGFTILGFEETNALGHGPVYASNQADSNWLNITERVLELPARRAFSVGSVDIPKFKSYHEWAELDFSILPEDRKDTFPPRSQLGRYLEARFLSLQSALIEAGVFELITDTVSEVSNVSGVWQVDTASGAAYPAEDILLTVGHQPTVQDDQISAWKEHEDTTRGIALFGEPYPIDPILKAARAEQSIRIAIRGYGLATIDVVRAAALEFGAFKVSDTEIGTLCYVPDGSADVVVTPFSLDGSTMGPKPLNPAIDAKFAPRKDMLDALSDHLSDRTAQEEAEGPEFLIDSMCRIAASQFLTLKRRYGSIDTDQAELERVAASWIGDQSYEHPTLLSGGILPNAALEKLIGMATDRDAVSFDYCIGQVWRHCQPIIYSALSYSALSDEVMAQIIFIDEGLKRYSYGPPVESLQQLLALYDAGFLNLDFLADPEIQTNRSGWTLSNRKDEFRAQIMVDAVLDSPNLKAVTSNLLVSLLDDGLIDPVHDKLGISTSDDAYIETQSGDADVPIALLGRLAKGTVIGVDAILECFGERPRNWSDAAVRRAEPQLAKRGA